jgi:hypothetical protein
VVATGQAQVEARSVDGRTFAFTPTLTTEVRRCRFPAASCRPPLIIRMAARLTYEGGSDVAVPLARPELSPDLSSPDLSSPDWAADQGVSRNIPRVRQSLPSRLGPLTTVSVVASGAPLSKATECRAPSADEA